MTTRALPPLNAVRAFEAAARHESFTKAAAELFVTPAAVSQQVKALENWLELALFERHARHLSLTPAGRAYLPRLTEVLDLLAEATDYVRRAGQVRVLTVSVPPGFAAVWLGPRLWSFATEHPDLDIRIAASMRPAEALQEAFDVVIRYGRGNYPGFTSELLRRDGLTPVCAPRLMEGPNALIDPRNLRHHTLLHNESTALAGFHVTWQDWLDAAGVDGVDGQRGLHFSDMQLVMQETIAGRGVGLGHMALIGEHLRAGRLVKPFDLVLAGRGDYYLVFPPGSRQQPTVIAFVRWLRAQMEQDTAFWPA
ncbi:MAG TPA: transcriptional regulator GcvA [Gammaproteobacteria bacterium]|nr:transcriptional regulator GcvA [Gammaproteobacteria bacterium]